MAMIVPGMLESFPFDSAPDLVYDDDGYPVYDRAVGARVMRDTFKKFFSDGVFPNPGTALKITKGEGLSVNIEPGGCIIKGAFGAVYEEPENIKLDSEPPKGNIAYAIMLRYDDTDDWRCIRFRVAKSEAASNPVPPMPDQTTPKVWEYRLGYVVVPNGATDLSNAVVTNEKGLAVCPYAAPFVEVDVSEIVGDFRNRAEEEMQRFGVFIDGQKAGAQAAVDRFSEFLAKNIEFVKHAIDGTMAGHLQNQIDELKQTGNIANALNPEYLEMARESPDQPEKVSFVAGAVKTRELSDGCVTEPKIADGSISMRTVAGIVDTPSGIASSSSVFEVLRDLSILRFNATVSDIIANQRMESAILWEFPEDTDLVQGSFDSGKDLYYSEVAS